MRAVWNRGLASVSAVLVVATAGLPLAGADVVVPDAPLGVPNAISGDFDGDGRTDVALTGAEGWNMVAVARGTASGFTVTMAPSPELAAATIQPGVKIVTADVDGDQDDEIVLVGPAGSTTMPVARFNGDGTFTVTDPAAGSFPQLASQSGVRLLTEDFNNDGRVDLALIGGGLTTIPIAFGNANATFTVTNAAAPEFTQQVAGDDVQVLTGDFDADGRTDLAAVPAGQVPVNDTIVRALSNGDGTFRQVSTDLPDFVADLGDARVAAADLNDDGRTDLAVAIRFRVRIAYSLGNDTFDLHEAEATTDFAAQAMHPSTDIFRGDYNCDGRDDLALVGGPGNAPPIRIASGTADPDVLSIVTNPNVQFVQLTRTPGVRLLPGDYNNDDCDDFAAIGGLGWTTIPTAIFNSNGLYTLQDRSAPDFATWAIGARPAIIPPAPPSTIGNLNIPEIPGRESSIAIGTDGLPIIAYYMFGPAGPFNDLEVAHCADTACTAFTHVTKIDETGRVGRYPSIKIGSDGLPLISYLAETDGASIPAGIADLKVAHCLNIFCTSKTIANIDTAARVSYPAALTIGADGLGLIAYFDTPDFSAPNTAKAKVKVAHCRDVTCTSADLRQVNEIVQPKGTGFDFGTVSRIGIATGSLGFGVIAYYDEAPNHQLLLTICTNADCSERQTRQVDIDVRGSTSMTIGLDGLPLISYRKSRGNNQFDLRVAHCQNPLCGSFAVLTADSDGSLGHQTAITVGGDGFGVISYHDRINDDLKLAHCTNLACTAATTTTVDAFDDVGGQPAIATGADGLPLLSYLGAGTNGLVVRVVHCGNSNCTAPIVAPF